MGIHLGDTWGVQSRWAVRHRQDMGTDHMKCPTLKIRGGLPVSQRVYLGFVYEINSDDRWLCCWGFAGHYMARFHRMEDKTRTLLT
jgi:hypothetical protein